jgi:hypothetical protein
MYFMILLAIVLSGAQADTLKLKNGTEVNGDYVGGTRLTIRFEVQNKIRHIPTSNIISLTFAHPEQTPKPISPEKPSAKRPDTPRPPTSALHQTGKTALVVSDKTVLSVRLEQVLDTTRRKLGDGFTVTLTKRVRQKNRVLIPKDTKLYGRITHIQSIKSGPSQLGLELTSMNLDDHIYSLATNRIAMTCDGELITVTEGESAFDAQADLGDFITPSGEIQIPSQTTMQFRLAAALHLRE